MNIRKGTIKDYDSLLYLHLQLEKAEIKFDSNVLPNCFATDRGMLKLKQRIRKRNSILLVYENDEGKVVGFVDGEVINKAWWYREKVAKLDYICGDEKYRRQGIAHMLFTGFENKAYNQGAKYIKLLAFPKNTPVINFYKKHGLMEYSVYYQKEI